MSAIVQDIFSVDLFATRIGDLDNLYLFADAETEKAYRLLWDASDQPLAFPLPLPGIGILKLGSRMQYGGREWEVILSTRGERAEYLFFSADGHQMTLPAEEAELLYAQQASPAERAALVERQKRHQISDMSRSEMEKATMKLKAVLSGTAAGSASTTRRAVRIVKNAPTLLDAFVALGGRDSDKGSRAPRLPPDTEQLAKQEIETYYNGPDAPSANKAFRHYVARCEVETVLPMSLPTFLLRVEKYGNRRTRGGIRAEYQAADIPLYLDIREPVHGLFPHELLYIDHTQINLFVDGPYNEDWGKPWLTCGRDGHVPVARAMYLDMRAPSQLAALMILRDYVRRWNRLPRIVVVDGAAEFKSGAFKSFCDMLGIDVRYRATNKPRGGGPIESLFGVTEDEFINGLEGSSILLKQPRAISLVQLPNERRRWKFESLYEALEFYLFQTRPTVVHPRLGMTPLEFESIRLQESGSREHLTVAFDENLLLLTSSYPPQHRHKVHPHRGIWETGDYYWHSDMSSLGGQRLEVRVEEWCTNVIYVNTGKKWLTAIRRSVEPYCGRQRCEVAQAMRTAARFNQLAARRARNTVKQVRRMVASSDRLVFDEKLAQQRQVIGFVYGRLNMTMARTIPVELRVPPAIGVDRRAAIFRTSSASEVRDALDVSPLTKSPSEDTWSEPDGRTGFL
ncbi:hypothetical protein [Paraburkholderia hospita]|uniref:hypothetical protein n=2 Tax=Burkholderiaceae TaxID=119060 RepID=UPI003ED10972